MGTGYNPSIVTDGLVFCVDAANQRSYPKSGTTWSDLAGSNNGTLANMDASNFDSANGGGLLFDGTDEYVHGGDTAGSITNPCSIAIWFKATGVPSNNDTAGGALFAQSNDFHHGIFISMSWAYSRILFSTYVNNSINSSTNSVSQNDYHYITGRQDGAVQQIFLNGELIASRSYTSAPYAANPAYQIGRWGMGSYQRYCNGYIYNLSLYNRALTADEIRQNYEATIGRYS